MAKAKYRVDNATGPLSTQEKIELIAEIRPLVAALTQDLASPLAKTERYRVNPSEIDLENGLIQLYCLIVLETSQDRVGSLSLDQQDRLLAVLNASLQILAQELTPDFEDQDALETLNLFLTLEHIHADLDRFLLCLYYNLALDQFEDGVR